MHARSLLLLSAVLSLAVALPAASQAQNLYWDTNSGSGGIQGGDGTWNSSSFWNDASDGSGTAQNWTANRNASFTATDAASTIDLEGNTYSVTNLVKEGTQNLTLTNGELDIGGNITVSTGTATLGTVNLTGTSGTQVVLLTGANNTRLSGTLDIAANDFYLEHVHAGSNNLYNFAANLIGSGDLLFDSAGSPGAHRTGLASNNGSGWTGNFVVNNTGLAQLTSSSFFTKNNEVDFQANGVLSTRATFTVAGLSGSTGTVRAEVVATMTIDTSVLGDASFGGTLQMFPGRPDILLNVTKTGAGTQTLSGVNTFTGTLTVSGGTLAVPTINNASEDGPLGNRAGAVLLGGSGTTGTLEYTGATAASDKPFTAVAGGTAAFSVTEAATVLTLSGLIDGTGDKSFGGAGSYVIAGGFGGTGTVTKTGAGAMTLTQAGHAGGYDIQAGRLNLNAASAIGNATSLDLGSGVELDNTSGAAVTINNGTVAISLGSSLDFVGTQDLSLGAGTVTLGANSAIDVQAGTLTFGGNVVDGGSGFGLTKNGVGTLVLSGLTAGGFSGNSLINAGELYLSGTSTLGGTAATTLTVQSGGTLRVGATASKGAVTLVIDGGQVLYESLQDGPVDFAANSVLNSSNALANGVQTIAAGVTVSASQDWLGSIPASPTAGRIVLENAAVLASTNAIDIDVNKGITLAGASATFDTSAGTIFARPVISGSGQLVKVGSSGFRLYNTGNDYTGGTVAREGTLGIYGDGSLGAVAGSLLLDGGTVNSAQGTSGQTITIDAARVVQLANGKTSGLAATNGSTLAYAGVLAEAAVGSAASLRIGSATQGGTVLLGGANTYAGDTTIAGGTLKLGSGGSLASSPRIIVGDADSTGAVFDVSEKTNFAIAAGQTLSGKGTVLLGNGTNLTIDGVLSPGNSPGLLTYDGGGTVTLSGTTLMEFAGGVRGTGYDAIDLVNSTDLNFGDGILQLDFDQTFGDGTTFDLFTPDLSSSLAGNFSLISMVGSAYSDLSFTDNAGVWTTNTGATNQSMSFNSTTGELSIIAVPEPSLAALAAFGLAAGLTTGLSWRRRRRSAAKAESSNGSPRMLSSTRHLDLSPFVFSRWRAAADTR